MQWTKHSTDHIEVQCDTVWFVVIVNVVVVLVVAGFIVVSFDAGVGVADIVFDVDVGNVKINVYVVVVLWLLLLQNC